MIMPAKRLSNPAKGFPASGSGSLVVFASGIANQHSSNTPRLRQNAVNPWFPRITEAFFFCYQCYSDALNVLEQEV